LNLSSGEQDWDEIFTTAGLAHNPHHFLDG